MNKITAIIVDDEKDSREVLSRLLLRYSDSVEVIAHAPNAEKAYDLIISLQPQLLFLDIQMPRGDGFSLLKRFSPIPFEVVFVTSYDQFAINAIRFNALDYLLKPIDIAELTAAVQKAINSIDSKKSSDNRISNLLLNLDAPPATRRFAVHTGETVTMLAAADIVCLEADGRYCNLHMKDGKRHTVAKNLRDFEEYLSDNSAFVRISKSCIINTAFIKEYSKGEPCIINMSNGQDFELPRRKKTEVLEQIKLSNK